MSAADQFSQTALAVQIRALKNSELDPDEHVLAWNAAIDAVLEILPNSDEPLPINKAYVAPYLALEVPTLQSGPVQVANHSSYLVEVIVRRQKRPCGYHTAQNPGAEP